MKKTLEQTHQLKQAAHSVYTIHYHIIQCVKYRRRVLCFPEINQDLIEQTKKICTSWKLNLIESGIDKNHIHLLVEAPLSLDVSKFIGNWKSSTSRVLRNRYPFLKRAISSHLWSPSYCLITCGNVALPVIKSYIKNQGKKSKVEAQPLK